MKIQEKKRSHKKKKPLEEKIIPIKKEIKTEGKNPSLEEQIKTEVKIPLAQQMISKRLRQIQEEMIKITKKNEATSKDIKDYAERGNLALESVQRMVNNFEDSMLHILHNIKKNQFLYAHYPDEWVRNYQDLKKGIKYENEFMQGKNSPRIPDPADYY